MLRLCECAVLEKLLKKRFLLQKQGMVFGLVRQNDLPGHTAGSMGYLIRVDGIKAMVTGDFFSLGLTTPDESEQEIMLAAMIKPSYSEEDYGKSLLKVADMDVDILLPGHLITYEGDVRTILLAAYHKLRTEPHEVMDLTKS